MAGVYPSQPISQVQLDLAVALGACQKADFIEF